MIMTMVAGAGAHADQAATPTAEEQVLALDQEWIDAEVNHDRGTLERILDDQFVVIGPSGKTRGKAAFIESILSRTIAPFKVNHDVVRIYRDTAIVVDRFGAEPEIKCTWVAIRREGHWRVIAEQMTAISPPER
jgi:hypothetical protein